MAFNSPESEIVSIENVVTFGPRLPLPVSSRFFRILRPFLLFLPDDSSLEEDEDDDESSESESLDDLRLLFLSLFFFLFFLE